MDRRRRVREAARASRRSPLGSIACRSRTRSRARRAAQLHLPPSRTGSSRSATRPTESIIVPSVSSERRDYIPIGYLGPDTVISDTAFAVYDAEPWVFALLTSRMHMAWTRAVGGQMKTRLSVFEHDRLQQLSRPAAAATQPREQLTVAALRVLDVREYHCEKTLAELYDPDLMPADLRAAHAEVDALVDSIYSKTRLRDRRAEIVGPVRYV